MSLRFSLILTALVVACSTASAEKLRALIVDGQNNHDVWPKSTVIMKKYLEDTGLFEVDVARVRYLWKWEREESWLDLVETGETEKLKKPKADPDFSPDFSKYDLVVSNMGYKAASWPEETRRNFEKYVSEGGGFAVVHAADNSWGDWKEFNRMIGLGGWGGRTEKHGPYVYVNDDGEVVRDDSPGKCGHHGPRSEFVVTIRDKEHPITQGLPDFWMHGKDECYSQLRGPAENLTILATACDTPALKKAGRHEPMLMVIDYDQGRVFHTTLGHDTPAFECVGFMVTFQRGCEWAATGKVTLGIPDDFPDAEKSSSREFKRPEVAP